MALMVSAVGAAVAQTPKENPLVAVSQGIGTKGLATAAKPTASPAAFKPSGGRIFVKEYVTAIAEDEGQRQALTQLIEKVMTDFESQAKSSGFSNDGASALAFATSLLYSLAKGAELDDEAFLALIDRYQATLNTPAVKGASDRQKQIFYEWTLCTVGAVSAVANADSGKTSTVARAQLIALPSADLDQLSFAGMNVSIKAKVAPETKPTTSTGALASGFSYTVPQGWTKTNSWFVGNHQRGSNVDSALVRFLPPVPAKGSFSDALRAAWKQGAPKELVGAGSGMIYRRYIGDGLMSQFMFGKGKEAGAKAPTLCTVFLIDCGTQWQPVVFAQTLDDPTSTYILGSDYQVQFSYPESAGVAESFFASFKCPAGKGKPLVDKAVLVGNYNYGTGANAQWENIYTGSVTMTYVTYGGTLNLKANGTFDYTYKSASGQIGAAKFGKIVAAGKWSVSGDILQLDYTSYDQGDGYKRKQDKFRIAGVVQYSDGEKICVFKPDLRLVINALTVMDKSDYYSTKK